MSRTYNAHAEINLEARVVLVTLGGRAPVALTMPAARDLLNSLTAAIAAQDARDAAQDAERTACGCMPEDPRDGGPVRVVTHSGTCPLSPLHPDFLSDAGHTRESWLSTYGECPDHGIHHVVPNDRGPGYICLDCP